jgi:hypothetical protein
MKKVVASLVLVGSLAAGSAGVAGAAPKPNCTNAPATIAQLKAEETQVASVLASLHAMAAQGGRDTAWLQWPIAFLTRGEARLAAEVSKLQTRCPSITTTGGTGSGGGNIIS